MPKLALHSSIGGGGGNKELLVQPGSWPRFPPSTPWGWWVGCRGEHPAFAEQIGPAVKPRLPLPLRFYASPPPWHGLGVWGGGNGFQLNFLC